MNNSKAIARGTGRHGHLKYLIIAMTISLFLLNASLVIAGMYKVNIKRVDSNLYKDTDSGIYIETRYCYKYSYGEDGVLIYEAHSYDNKLIFKDGDTCDVVKILK